MLVLKGANLAKMDMEARNVYMLATIDIRKYILHKRYMYLLWLKKLYCLHLCTFFLASSEVDKSRLVDNFIIFLVQMD